MSKTEKDLMIIDGQVQVSRLEAPPYDIKGMIYGIVNRERCLRVIWNCLEC